MSDIDKILGIERWEWVRARETEWCVYRLKDMHGNIVYVGQTRNIISRLRQHRRGGLIKFFTADYFVVPDLEFALLLETQLISAYQPKFNELKKPSKALLTWAKEHDSRVQQGKIQPN